MGWQQDRQRLRTERGRGELAWFQKAIYLLDHGWRRLPVEETAAGWRDPRDGSARSLGDAYRLQRERD